MRENEISELIEERDNLRALIGSMWDAISIIEQLDNNHRDEIVEVLREKITDLKRKADSIFDLIIYKKKEKDKLKTN